MLIIPASIVLSAIQIVSLLILVKIIGHEQYGKYSIYFSIAVSFSALASEWVRLLVARYSSARQSRLRNSILKSSLTSIYLIGFCALGLAGVISFAAKERFFSGILNDPWSCLAVGALTFSSITGDATATFIRFNKNQKIYVAYMLLRVLASSTAMLSSAWLTRGYLVPAMMFALSVSLVAAVFGARYWWGQPGRVRRGLIWKLSARGWAMATSAISSNFSMSIARLAIQGAVAPSIAGAIFLAFDLASRGVTVLGTALNTWSVKLVYGASGRSGDDQGKTARASALLAGAWGVFGATGVGVAAVVPLVMGNASAYGASSWVVVVNCVAIILLMLRVFNVDVMLNASNEYAAVFRCSLISFVVTAALALMPGLKVYAFPLGAFLSFLYACWSARGIANARAAALDAVVIAGLAFFALVTAIATKGRLDAWALVDLGAFAALLGMWSVFQFKRWKSVKAA